MNSLLRKNDRVISLILMASFFLPFINMPPYADDIARYSSGYIGLYDQGRFFSEFLIKAINGFTGTYAIDAYVPLLIASFAASYILLKYISGRIGVDMYILLPIFITPYMLENISYHVDIICMYISFTLSIIASFTSFISRKHISAFIYLTCASFFYQVSFSVYASFTVLMLVVTMIDGRNNATSALRSLAPSIFVFAVSFIFVIFATKIFATSGYINEHSTFIKFNEDWLGTINNNIGKINEIAFHTLSKLQSALIYLIATVYIASTALYLKRNRNDLSTKLMTVVLPFLSLPLIYLPTAIFMSPVVMPRIMMAYGVILTTFLILPYRSNDLTRSVIYMLSTILIATFILCASTYVASTNYIYDKNISTARKIESDIFNDNATNKPEYFYGEMKPSPTGINLLAEKSFPIIKIMTRFPINNSWLTPHIFNLYNINLKYKDPDFADDYNEREIVTENNNYKLYRTKTRYVAVFK